jgi:hypothetical protein
MKKILVFAGVIAIMLFAGCAKQEELGGANSLAINHQGTISGGYSSTTAPVKLVAGNSARVQLDITNVGNGGVFIWEVSTTTAAAATLVTRNGGLYLGPNGSYSTPDNGVLWTGDIWISTSSAEQLLTYTEK